MIHLYHQCKFFGCFAHLYLINEKSFQRMTYTCSVVACCYIARNWKRNTSFYRITTQKSACLIVLAMWLSAKQASCCIKVHDIIISHVVEKFYLCIGMKVYSRWIYCDMSTKVCLLLSCRFRKSSNFRNQKVVYRIALRPSLFT